MNSIQKILTTTLGFTTCLLAQHSVVEAREGAPDFNDVIHFESGDILNGELKTYHTGGNSLWNHPDVETPLSLDSSVIQRITLSHLPYSSGPVDSWKVHLANEDTIEGTNPILDEHALRLTSINLGEISIPRSLVSQMIQVLQRRPPIYHGFDNIDAWTIGEVTTEGLEGGSWAYTNKAIYAFKAASIARKFDLPDIATIGMDVAWKGTLGIAIGLYTDTLEPISLLNKEMEKPFGGFYSLAIFNQGAVLRAINHTDPIRTLGQMFVPILNQKDHARLEVRVNKPLNAIQLAMDGEVVHTFVDSKGFIGEGTGIRIVHQGRGGVRISNFDIRHWNGEMAEATSSPPNGSSDIVWIDGSPQIEGKVQSIQSGEIDIEANRIVRIDENGAVEDDHGGQRTVAAEDVRKIEFAIDAPESLPASQPNARVQFANGDRITVTFNALDEEFAYLNAFGTDQQKIDRRHLAEVDFKIKIEAEAPDKEEPIYKSPFIFTDP